MLPVNKRATTKGPSPRSLSRSAQEVSSLPPFYARTPPLSSEILHRPSLFSYRAPRLCPLHSLCCVKPKSWKFSYFSAHCCIFCSYAFRCMMHSFSTPFLHKSLIINNLRHPMHKECCIFKAVGGGGCSGTSSPAPPHREAFSLSSLRTRARKHRLPPPSQSILSYHEITFTESTPRCRLAGSWASLR